MQQSHPVALTDAQLEGEGGEGGKDKKQRQTTCHGKLLLLGGKVRR